MAVPPDAVQAQLQRILSSKSFATSARLTRFLRFTVTTALEGRAAELKEYVIGVEVFDRKASFDPRVEPIVRVEARRLRAKLRQYYETDGKLDTLIIDFPKGSYTPKFRSSDAVEPAAAKPAAPARNTVAVLPFANLGSDADNEYFSDGLTEELIHALTKVEGLLVVARPSAFHFKGQTHDVQKIGEQLGVHSVFEGSVRRSGTRLRISAQLIEVATGFYLWSETYERKIEDVFAIQEEIAHAIVDALKVKLTGSGERRLGQRQPENLEAYQAYLRGRYHWNKRTVEGMHKAIDCFQTALQADPRYAAAYAGLADAFTILGEYGIAPPATFMPKAKQAALQALSLDDTLAEAHTSLAAVLATYDRDWPGAQRHYTRALTLNPGYATAHHWYAYEFLAPMGRLDEALEEIQRAHQLDPLSIVITSSLAAILGMQRKFDLAVRQFRAALELDGSFYRANLGLGRTLVDMGRYDEAIAVFERLRVTSSDFSITLALLGNAYAVAGRLADAQAVVDKLFEQARHRYVSPFVFARIYLGFPDKEPAFEWLEKTFEERDSHLLHLKVSPTFDCIRTDQRYHVLLNKMGLID